MAGRVNLEKNVTYLNRFMTGLYSQRSPLFTPMSTMGLQVIQRMDSLWDGENTDISHSMTLIRRPGFGTYCSQQLTAGDYPQKYFSFKNTAGVVRAMVETPSAVSVFTATGVTEVITKSTILQGSMNKVASTFYYCDGNDSDTLKWDGTNLTKWGIAAPTIAPTIDTEAGTLTTVNGGYQYVYVYRNANTGHISSASRVSASTLNVANKSFGLSGPCSNDVQVTNVDIYRIEDGGGVFYFCASVANIPGTNWQYTDQNVDAALNTDLVVVPGSHSNDPPPSGANLSVLYQNRFFIAAGPFLYFSGGPDITNGQPEESFPPANVFRLPGSITALAATSQGLLVWTSSDCYVVLGNSTLTYYLDDWQKNFGVAGQNCIAQDGDTVFVFTTNAQLFQISVSSAGTSMSEVGFPIQGRLAAFPPTTTYLAIHRAGVDEGMFISDGVAKMYRYSVSMGCWSTPYNVVGGCGAISSIEVTTANYALLMGRSSGNNAILVRTPNAQNDNGSTYPCWVTIGSLVLSPPGETATVESILVEMFPFGTYPTVSVLLNEINEAGFGQTGFGGGGFGGGAVGFVDLPNPVADPPLLPASVSMWSNRHYLKYAQVPLAHSLVRHLQIRLNFVAEDVPSEVMGIAVA